MPPIVSPGIWVPSKLRHVTGYPSSLYLRTSSVSSDVRSSRMDSEKDTPLCPPSIPLMSSWLRLITSFTATSSICSEFGNHLDDRADRPAQRDGSSQDSALQDSPERARASHQAVLICSSPRRSTSVPFK